MPLDPLPAAEAPRRASPPPPPFDRILRLYQANQFLLAELATLAARIKAMIDSGSVERRELERLRAKRKAIIILYRFNGEEARALLAAIDSPPELPPLAVDFPCI